MVTSQSSCYLRLILNAAATLVAFANLKIQKLASSSEPIKQNSPDISNNRIRFAIALKKISGVSNQ